jgi:hypothetical protein
MTLPEYEFNILNIPGSISDYVENAVKPALDRVISARVVNDANYNGVLFITKEGHPYPCLRVSTCIAVDDEGDCVIYYELTHINAVVVSPNEMQIDTLPALVAEVVRVINE